MKIKLSAVLIVFVLLSINCSTGDVTPSSPEKLLKAFSSAVNSDDKVKAETFFTKECWSARNDSGERFFKQAESQRTVTGYGPALVFFSNFGFYPGP